MYVSLVFNLMDNLFLTMTFNFQDTNIEAQQPSNIHTPIYLSNIEGKNLHPSHDDDVNVTHVGDNYVQYR